MVGREFVIEVCSKLQPIVYSKGEFFGKRHTLGLFRPHYQLLAGFLDFGGLGGPGRAPNRPSGASLGPPGRPATLIFDETGWGTTRGALRLPRK